MANAKVKKITLYKQERYKFLNMFYKICGVYGANYFEKLDSEKKYIICASDDLVFPMLATSNCGYPVPYFPDEHSAETVIKKLGKDNLLKYWFNAEKPTITNFEYLKSLSPEKLSKFLAEPEWCDRSCYFDGNMYSERCAECLLKWFNSKRKDEEECNLPF